MSLLIALHLPTNFCCIYQQIIVTIKEYRYASSDNLRRLPELAQWYSSTVTKPLAVPVSESSQSWQAIIPSRSVAGLGFLRQPLLPTICSPFPGFEPGD